MTSFASLFAATRLLPLIVLLSAITVLSVQPAKAEEESEGSGVLEWLDQNFIDPEDGALDVSEWLESGGFFPIPLVITEPAVDNGLGLAGVFIHGGDAEAGIAPDLTGAAAAYTGNESTLFAAFHQGNYLADDLRYTGAIGQASLNLDFFRGGSDAGFGFNFDGFFTLHNARYRLGESNAFAGLRWQYLDSTVSFRGRGLVDPAFSLPGEKVRMSGLGPVLSYDSRDNIFTPEDGVNARLLLSVDSEAWGSDFEFSKLDLSVFGFHPIGERWHLSGKFDFEHVFGNAPFFAEPFVDLRGIPAVRYQGEAIVDGEFEVRREITDRWSLLGFAGLGIAGGKKFENFDQDGILAAGGAGFRYLVARKLNLHVGLDVARGPEDTVVYLQFGHAWQRD